MKTLLMLCPSPLDPTSFYRGWGPFGHLARTRGDVQLDISESPDWNLYQKAHVAFFQRPCNMNHVRYIKQIKEWGLPLWIDYDDDLMAVTPDNPVYSTYANNEVRQSLLSIIPLADVVTVSANVLKQRYEHLNKNIHVIPNGLDERMIAYRRPPRRMDGINTVLWRGSPTHQKDLQEFAQEILKASEKHDASRWYFQGYNPYFITDKMPEHKKLLNEQIPIEAYFRMIHDGVRPALGIVPLWDSPFNKAKSNIALLETAFAGAPSIVPDWTEWKLPGAIRYDTVEEFGEKLDDALSRPHELKERAEETWSYISENLLLKKVNQQRADILSSLVS